MPAKAAATAAYAMLSRKEYGGIILAADTDNYPQPII
jgi:hypothetical protein